MVKNRERDLVKNTFIITIGKASTQLITFLLLPLYTTILSTEEYGVVDLLNTLVLLLLPIVTLQIEQAIFRNLIESRDDENKKTNVITNGLVIVFFQIALFLFIFLLLSNFIHNDYKYFLATNLIAYIFSGTFLQMARGLGDNKKYSIGSCISAGATIVFNVLFLVFIKLGANGMLLGTLLGQLICSIYIFVFLKIYRYCNFKSIDKNLIKKMLVYSIPLVPNAISWWIFNTSDRVIVSAVMGLAANGILSVASKFSVIYVGIYNMFNMSWTESISLHINDSDIENYFKRMFDVILRIFSAFVIVMISFMPIIYKIMINSNYIEGYKLVPLLLVASLFNVIVGLISVIYIAKKNTKSLAITSIGSAIINIVSHIALIKYIGLYAAVVSTFISYLCLALYRLIDISKKYFKIVFYKGYLIITALVLGFVLIAYYINNIYLTIISMLISLIYTFVMNRKIIFKLKNIILKKFKFETQE